MARANAKCEAVDRAEQRVVAARRWAPSSREDAALEAQLARQIAGQRPPPEPMQGFDPHSMEGLFRRGAAGNAARLLPIMFIVPVFSGRVVTGMVRSGLIAILAVFVAPSMEGAAMNVQGGGLDALALKEALIGVLLGMAFGAPGPSRTSAT
ncbi:flagellar biosynthetic protein FliR [Cupriavidus basilensis]